MNHKELSLSLKNMSILYVEDDEETSQLMYSTLSLLSNNIHLAKNGIDALNLYHTAKPQLIISDIEMPKMSGIDFVKEIRKLNSKIPIILLSAHTDAKYLLPAANLNIQSYLVKPVQSEKLREALYHIIKILDENNNLYIILSNSLKYNKTNLEITSQDNQNIKLNLKEKKLIDLLILNQNKIVTYSEIENFVWDDYDEIMTSMALRTIIKNLRKKISSKFIENVSGQGYRVVINS